jgi:hypothetical protein
MNCREFLAEFEERRNALSETAQVHLNDCPGCKKTSGEQTRVWQMIDGLRRVDAPNDFDFRVKAKIANAKPADFQPRFFPVLRYVLPLSLIVLVFGLLAFNTSFFFGSNDASQVAGVDTPPTPEREISPVNSFSSNQIAAANTTDETTALSIVNANVEVTENNQEEKIAMVKLLPKPRPKAPKNNVVNKFEGGSRDSTVSEGTVQFPLNLDPNQTVKTSPNGNNSNSVSGEEILKLLGVEVIKEGGNLKVKAVRENSSGERSDVKVGDVIEAINGVKLSAEPLRAKQIEVKKLTVARGAEKIEIVLQNQ